jgi:putative redox protein
MKTITTWKNGGAFKSTQNSAAIDIDSNKGFSPKALLLTGLAGCTGVDIVDILEKMRLPFSELIIEAEAEQTEEHPRVFKTIHLRYIVGAEEAERDRVVRAIELSLQKYCGVAAMLRKNSEIVYELQLTGAAL